MEFEKEVNSNYEKALSLANSNNADESKRGLTRMIKLAREGYAPAQLYIGRYLEHVRGDDAGACKMYKQAADNGDMEAAKAYADMLLAGKGVEQDYKEAERYYKKAGIEAFIQGQESKEEHASAAQDSSLDKEDVDRSISTENSVQDHETEEIAIEEDPKPDEDFEEIIMPPDYDAEAEDEPVNDITEKDASENGSEGPEHIDDNNSFYNEPPAKHEENKKKHRTPGRKKYIVLIIILAVILAALGALLFMKMNEVKELESANSTLIKENSKLRAYESVVDDWYGVDAYYVWEEDDKYYHRPGCPETDEYEVFWVTNKEWAESDKFGDFDKDHKLKPCPKCIKEDLPDYIERVFR